jgi:aspartate aminotransferase
MSIHSPSANVAALRESATIAASARAKALRAAGRPVIDLGAGEPDFPTPSHICDAARRAIESGATRYTAVEGIAPLREAIANHANRMVRGSEVVTAADVTVTTGTKQALFNACFVLFATGDEVLIPTPAWTSYYEMVSLARATAVVVRGAPARSFKITPDDLRRAATARTRGVILNSPCNPTGAVYTAEELSAIVACAREEGWWMVSDEIYRELSFDRPAPSLLEVAPTRDRLIIVDGVAKSFAMTGWRIGWSIASGDVTRSMTALQSHTTSNAATPSQYAALAALTEVDASRAAIASMVESFRQRRDAAVALLTDAGVEFVRPEGAFYVFIRVGTASGEGADPGSVFARELLETADVAVVPGVAFHAPEWIRVSYAAAREEVLEGLRRIIQRLR